MGGRKTVNYEGGELFNKDGSAYEGKVNGFLKTTLNALNNVRSTREGGEMLEELESSKNVFTIVKGSDNKFVASDNNKAHANQWKTDPTAATGYAQKLAAGTDFTGGSGGTIYFNPNNGFVWEQGGKQTNRPAVSVGHELFHGLDANRGLLDSRTHLGITRSEWQATYRENTMRQQMGVPLRTDYKTLYNPNTGVSTPNGPPLLDPTTNPILPSWYKP